MKLLCANCNVRPVFVVNHATVAARRYGSSRGVGAHDLCDACHRRLRNKTIAARMAPKPNWAIRSTLRVLEEQRTSMQAKAGRSLG